MQVSLCSGGIEMSGRFSRQVEADPQSIAVTAHSAHRVTGKNWHHLESP